MCVNIYILAICPPLYFPPAGGKPLNTASFKAVEVFLAPVGGKMSDSPCCRTVAAGSVAAGGQKGGFFYTYSDLKG